VIGAHAQGFNTGSTGVAVLGTYSSGTISAKARTALTALLSWRLDLAHVDPASVLTWTSGGNPKFPAGTAVSLRAVSGHRDTGSTSCPGAKLHGELGALATAIRALGGPKIFAPRSTGALGGQIRFTAILSEARAWTVDVFDTAGARVAGGSGSTKAVDWTWSSGAAPPGRYTYKIAAGTGVRAATGVVGGSVPPLALTSLVPSPAITTPNGDGTGDRQKVKVGLTRSAVLDVRLETPEGTPVATVVANRALAAGTRTVSWKGKDVNGTKVPDGRYVLVADATSGAEHVSRSVAVRVDRTLARLVAAPTPFSPNGDRRRDAIVVGFDLRRAATVDARVASAGRRVATLRSGSLAVGRKSVTWDGRDGDGAVVRDGTLTVVVDATTNLGTRRLTKAIVLDTTRPVVKILAARRVRAGTSIRLSLSERANLVIRLGGKTVRVSLAQGTRTIVRPIRTSALTVYSFDPAGNAGKPVSKRVG
jgi:flagellar hook assembly protein FlgD